MDILYIVGKGKSTAGDIELRCSLRSIALHGKGIGKVYVVGYCPAWLSEKVVRIPLTDTPQTTMGGKNRNILAATLYAVQHSNIGEDFLVSMDDHFYAEDVDFDHYPFYVKRAYGDDGRLPDSEGKGYTRYLYETRLYLESKGLPTYCYTLHRNMHCSRRWLEGCRDYIKEIFDKGINCEPWVLLNNYAHSIGEATPTITDDKKMESRMAFGKAHIEEAFSTGDFRNGGWVHRHLLKLYPDKCIYER